MNSEKLHIKRFIRLKKLILDGKESEAMEEFREIHDGFKSTRQALQLMFRKVAERSDIEDRLNWTQRHLLKELMEKHPDPAEALTWIAGRIAARDRACSYARILKFLLSDEI